MAEALGMIECRSFAAMVEAADAMARAMKASKKQLTPDDLSEIAKAANLLTGTTDKTLGGATGELFMFAPRFFALASSRCAQFISVLSSKNVAVTVVAVASVTVHGAVPAQPPPDQPANDEVPAVGTAVSKAGVGEVREEKHRGIGVALGHPLSEALVATLDRAGLSGRAFARAADMKWSKLLTNLTGNATSAILDRNVTELFSDKRTYALEVAVLAECLAVMRAKGYRVVDLPGTPVRALA